MIIIDVIGIEVPQHGLRLELEVPVITADIVQAVFGVVNGVVEGGVDRFTVGILFKVIGTYHPEYCSRRYRQ